jgi:hypothetical protein
MSLGKEILHDFIINELGWAMRASNGTTKRDKSNLHYHMERTLAYLEELIIAFAKEHGEEVDNGTLS